MIDKENAWDQKFFDDICVVEGPVEEISIEEITSAIKKMKLGKTFGLSDMSLEMIMQVRKLE